MPEHASTAAFEKSGRLRPLANALRLSVQVSKQLGRWAVRTWTWLRSKGLSTLSRCIRFVFGNFNKLLWAIVVILVFAILVRGLTEHVTVIEPISVPKIFEESGYTPEIAGKRLRDALVKFASTVSTSMKTPDVALHGELPNIVVPSVGISLDAILSTMRTLVRSTRSRSISGEFTVVDKQLGLRLRLDGREFYSSAGGNLEKPDQLLATAAPEVLKMVQPYIVAAAMSASNPMGALDMAESIIDQRPESDENVIWSHNLKGSIFFKSGVYLSAREAFDKALSLNSRLAVAHVNLGLLCATEGDHETAISEYNKAIALNSELMVAHNNLATELIARGNPEGAILELQKATKLDSKSPLVHRNLGNAQKALKNEREAAAEYAQAIAQYKEALQANPKDPATHLSLAETLRLAGHGDESSEEYTEAITEYRNTIASEPKNLIAHNNLGNALRLIEKYDEAVAAFQDAIAVNAGDIAARFSLAFELRRSKKYDEAIVAYHEVINLEPRFASAHNNLGVTLEDQEKYQEAADEYRAAIKVDPNVALFHNNLGRMLMELKKNDDAIAEFHTVLKIYPKNAVALDNLKALTERAKRD